jgi:hypothetical protein
LPFAPGSWIELIGGADTFKGTPRTTADGISDPRAWAGLEAFHRLLCEGEFLNKRLSNVDEFQRLRSKAAETERAREAAMGAIGSVLGGTGVWNLHSFVGSDLGPIFAAMQAIGRHLGVEIKSHPEGKEKRSFDDSVLSVCLASRLRLRRVALVDDWWRRDQGALLAQHEESKAPIALIPVSPTKYEALDPVTGARQPVDAAYARTLASFATTFYAGFADGPVGAKQLLRFAVRGLGPDFRSVVWMGITLGVLGTVPPMLTGKVFDTAIPQAEKGMLFQFAGGLFLMALAQAAFKITQSIATIRMQGKMDYAAQSAVWDRLLDLPMTFFRDYSAGDLADRASGVDQMRGIVAGAGIAAILGSFSSLFNVFQMLGYDFTLAAVAIGLTVVYVLVTTFANFLQLRYQRDEQRKRGRITGLILQLISGVAKLRVCGAENHAFRVWATAFSEQRKVSFRVGRVKNVMQVWNACFPVLSTMLIFFTVVSLKQSAAESGTPFEMTTGDFLAFSAAYGMFLAAMQALGDASLSMLKIIPVWERLRPILETLPEVDATKAYPGKLTGAIDISHVSFRYSEDGPWILKDVSLKIKAGEFVALVGSSGSGQVDADAADAGLRNLGSRVGLLRRPGPGDARPAAGALADGRRPAGEPSPPRRHLPQHCRFVVAHRRGGLGGGGKGRHRRRRARHADADAHRDLGGRRRLLGRPEAAPDDRPRHRSQAADPVPRRSHFGARQQDAGDRHREHEQAGGDENRHRPPAVDHRPGRPDLLSRAGRAQGAGHVRRAHGEGRPVRGARQAPARLSGPPTMSDPRQPRKPRDSDTDRNGGGGCWPAQADFAAIRRPGTRRARRLPRAVVPRAAGGRARGPAGRRAADSVLAPVRGRGPRGGCREDARAALPAARLRGGGRHLGGRRVSPRDAAGRGRAGATPAARHRA